MPPPRRHEQHLSSHTRTPARAAALEGPHRITLARCGAIAITGGPVARRQSGRFAGRRQTTTG